MISTFSFTRKSGMSSNPGSRRTVRLHRSMIFRSGRMARAFVTNNLKALFISGAPPVRSRVCTDGLFRSSSRHCSATSKLICSLTLSGEDSTWQWVQAWLQYKPIFSCKILGSRRFRGPTPPLLSVAVNGGSFLLVRDCSRDASSSSGVGMVARPPFSTSSMVSGIRLVGTGRFLRLARGSGASRMLTSACSNLRFPCERTKYKVHPINTAAAPSCSTRCVSNPLLPPMFQSKN
mmetsp:Transcript_37344/g.89821  ORF Transcript_37344/g.89821 Transcript_37344/m.89821 type:complete len:234 (-) Transcript_37344:16-717(-)